MLNLGRVSHVCDSVTVTAPVDSVTLSYDHEVCGISYHTLSLSVIGVRPGSPTPQYMVLDSGCCLGTENLGDLRVILTGNDELATFECGLLINHLLCPWILG